jgi:hypothetical protein
MNHLIKSHVYRFELPGTNSFNFLLTHALGGGGVQSLQMDRQGKIYAQILLSMPVTVPEEWVVEWLAQRQKNAEKAKL